MSVVWNVRQQNCIFKQSFKNGKPLHLKASWDYLELSAAFGQKRPLNIWILVTGLLFLVYFFLWLNTLDTLNILCVGLKLGTSYNRAWAESWEGQTNTRCLLKANWTLWYHWEKRKKVGRWLRLQYMERLFLLQLIRCSCQTVCMRW